MVKGEKFVKKACSVRNPLQIGQEKAISMAI